MKKLNQYRAGLYMALHYREIRTEINFLLRKHNFAGALQAVINHLRHLSTERNIDKICQHIEFLGTIYGRGNHYVKYILENLFVRSLGGLQRISTVHTWTVIEARLPVPFLEIRKGQQIHNLLISK
ncbi:MAG: hypothetical protein LBV59_12845 [Sphingobacterium sp.]|jgi:hypothetical protein|uniref:DUF7674 family protein n=1 Tax=unclassified Sphingobacterium TaxID=2609468 RepID=UPI0025E0E493|nr:MULTISPECIES: hypothetical protein [unclassified Sphingobacterium]MDR3008820.1 hypothetical protein [Sphingobacterium sp.]